MRHSLVYYVFGMNKPTQIALVLFSMLMPLTAQALEGKVVGVSDGDTLTLLDATKSQRRVRLAEIDSPESNQEFGRRAKEALSKLCFGKHAEVRDTSADRYQRVVGKVYCDGVNANAELVRQGMAWVYVQYASKSSPLFDLEKAARAKKQGLWADPHPTPPWEWRRAARAGNNPVAESPNPTKIAQRVTTGAVRGNSRSGVYHLVSCPSYDSVSLKNRVEFESEQAAAAAGFRKAGNCR